jgi:lysozyme
MAQSDGSVPGVNPRLLAVLVAAGVIAIPAEGLRQKAYKDPGGITTVCWGHTGSVDPNKVYTLEECKQLLDADMKEAVLIVDKCQPDLPDSVLIAFSDTVFNAGPTVACNKEKSTAARLLAQKKYVEACNQLPRWSYAKVAGVLVQLPGLVKRREHAKQVCLKGLV